MRRFFLACLLCLPTAVWAAGNLTPLHGRLCSWGAPVGDITSYSQSSWFSFDGAGHLQYGSEGSFLNADGVPYRGSGDVSGTYRLIGNRVHIHLEDGTRALALVRKRGSDGAVVELTVNGNVYTERLCQ